MHLRGVRNTERDLQLSLSSSDKAPVLCTY